MNSTVPQFVKSVAPVLPVKSVPSALEHYQKLGFEVTVYEEPEGSAPVYGFVCLGAVELHLACVADIDPAQTTSACYLYVADADALYEQWRSAEVGGRLHPPQDTPYGLREFAHVDPDGNLLRVGSPLDADCEA
jgi:uncharacterized glyoxalase superfamily protein PhnB